MAENLAAEAAAFVRGRRAEVFGISRAGDGDGAVRAKSSPTDPVTVVDTDTERLLRVGWLNFGPVTRFSGRKVVVPPT